MFSRTEIAKDHFKDQGIDVIGGIVSPVHDAYGKKGLVSQTHRLAMLKHALQTSSWIRISEWETQQEGWTRTKNTLQYHQNYLNSIIRDINGINSSNLPSWIPENVRQIKDPVQIKLLCGADLLESFATPGLWEKEDVRNSLTISFKCLIFFLLDSLRQFLDNTASSLSVAADQIQKDLSSTQTYSANIAAI